MTRITLILEGFWKDHKDTYDEHMLSHIKLHSLTTYHVLLAEYEEFILEFYALELTMGFQQLLGHLPSSNQTKI